MQDFIILGLIPGTNIQIDFRAWIIFSTCFVTLSVLVYERWTIRNFVLSHYVAFRINHLRITQQLN